jgi:hypothetical protein
MTLAARAGAIERSGLKMEPRDQLVEFDRQFG